jgi:hypothetical protein
VSDLATLFGIIGFWSIVLFAALWWCEPFADKVSAFLRRRHAARRAYWQVWKTDKRGTVAELQFRGREGDAR